MGSEKSAAPDAILVFDTRAEANRRVAGVAAAARLAREAIDAGRGRLWLAVPGRGPLHAATIADLDRLTGGAPVEVREGQGLERLLDEAGATATLIRAVVPTTSAVLRATGKSTDGPVSKWINRPVSRLMSRLLLPIAGMRPYHATIATAVVTTAMFIALLFGGHKGLIAGGLLLQLASIVDGVDGEIARATYRSSPAGAALDSAVDAATNCLFVLGLTVNLAKAGTPNAAWLGVWGLAAFAGGLLLLGWRASRSDEPLGFDLIKGQFSAGASGRLAALLARFAIIVTSRDFFALAWALLILAGLPMIILYGLAMIATGWFLVVVASFVPAGRERRA